MCDTDETTGPTQPTDFDDVESDHADLAAAIDAELAVDIHELSPEQLGARSLRLRHQVDRLEIAIARGDAAFEATKAYARIDGAVSTAAQWLAKHRQVSLTSARAAYRHARRLQHLPWVVIGVLCGAITGWHAHKLTGVASTPKRLRHFAREQLRFITAGITMSGKDFGDHVDYFVEEHYGDEAAARAEAAEAGRHASWAQTYGDIWNLSAMFETHWGTLFANVADTIYDRLTEHDWSVARAEHGDDARPAHLPRTATQRRSDALVAMAMLADSALPNAAKRRPVLSVLVNWELLHDRICETEQGTHLTPDQMLDVLRIADIERAVMGSDDRVTVSKTQRCFTGAERRAVELRDRFCTTEACDIPSSRCDIHHDTPWSQQHYTDQSVGQAKCPGHHDNRRRPVIERDLPWEHEPDHWDDAPTAPFDLDDEMIRLCIQLGIDPPDSHGYAS